MPFQGGFYYPYNRDNQGAHSSAGIPSLLNSPFSQSSINGHCAPGMTPSSGISTAPLFRFQPRRESVDWRRMNAVDIDAVVSQMDVGVLQEYITTVTYCSLDGERCPRCQSPVDPALVKLLRLAQLTVEYLLHCQELLTAEMHMMEERLEAAGKDRVQLQAQLKEKDEQIKTLNEELKQRRKVIRTQQRILAPSIINSHKCLHCEKSFLNATFLQNHMQRRHPEEYDANTERKSEMDSLKSEITALKEQIVQQQTALQNKIAQEKEQESLHRDLIRELDRFKAEEMARMDQKIEGCRDGIRREMEFLYTRNIQALNDVNQQQSTRPGKSSPVQMEPEKDLDNYNEMQKHAIHKLEQQLKKQDKKFESRLQNMKDQHESEKNQLLNELNRMQITVSEQQEHSQRLRQDLGRKLQEKEHIIKSQKEQIKKMASSPPARVVETQVLQMSAAPELKQKRVVLESSSVSEAKPVEKRPEPAPEKKQRTTINALRRNPDLRREMRPELETSVMRKLQSYGVKANRTGLKTKEMESILVKVQAERQRTSKDLPDYWSYRQEVSDNLDNKLGRPKKSQDHRNKQPLQVLQIYPRSNSLPSKAATVTSVSSERVSKTPQPIPRSKSIPSPKTSTPKDKPPRRYPSMTPPFSSDEDSEEEDTDAEEERQLDQRNKPSLVQSRTTPVLTKQASVTSVSSLPSRGKTTEVTKTTLTKMKMDSDDEETWSDVSELQEIDPKQSFKDQNGNVERKSFGKENKISEMGKKIEKQFTDRLGKKPAGGVSILPERKDEVQELSCTDLEESNEWSSSVEDKVSKPVHGSAALRKSLDSASTSVWGTSTGKGPKSSLTEASTGSTLKSTIYSISDASDDDFSNN
ncbi:cilium assembly protein DZIP1 isoform X2 [Periophthalmus magnuspinnatus]|uniref:cilium assembly protein DZIP1 isoform X2 n=1 Tax=Periophthalmus magnuspinnatus TaxID=409849 RepID=UPI00243729E4|nr:cilium assembly protein DZIP1 isoform X2 [Periophthalmus magnuspinnatus]